MFAKTTSAVKSNGSPLTKFVPQLLLSKLHLISWSVTWYKKLIWTPFCSAHGVPGHSRFGKKTCKILLKLLIQRQQLQLFSEQLRWWWYHSVPRNVRCHNRGNSNKLWPGRFRLGVETTSPRQVPRRWPWLSRSVAGSQSAEFSEAGMESAVADLVQSWMQSRFWWEVARDASRASSDGQCRGSSFSGSGEANSLAAVILAEVSHSREWAWGERRKAAQSKSSV